ncbi:MAG: sigma-70 family RNA polymerase sigma factor [Thermoanaerobaculia bacterium]
MTDMPSDATFVPALRDGSPEAFETLVRTYAAGLLRVARRFLNNEEDARDAVQDAFIAAFRSIQKFEAGSKLSTWLHRIVVNSALMKLRTRRRHPEEDLDELLPRFQADGHQLEPSVEWAVSADEMVERKETRELVRKSIDELPESYRVVLLMRDIEEMSTDETAKGLGITPAAVKVRLHRARQALRTILDRKLRGNAT